MEKSEALKQMREESGNLKGIVHSDMPERKLNNSTSFDAVAGDKLDNADVISTTIKAKDNGSYPPDNNLFTQSTL